MIASTTITNADIFIFIAALVFKLLSLVYKKKRQYEMLQSRLLFKKTANFKGKLLQNYKQLECKIFTVFWNMLAVVFQCFFNLNGCTFKDSFSPVLVFKKASFKLLVKSRNFGHLVHNQQNYITLYWNFLGWMENSC